MQHRHNWSRFGILKDGSIIRPCKSKTCDVAAITQPDSVRGLTTWTTTIDGIVLDLDEPSEEGLSKFICKEFETFFVPFINKISFKPGDIIVDIGAHIGAPSIYLAKKYPMTRIYSIEPLPENYKCLIRNRKVNQVEGNIEPFNLGITEGFRKMVLNYSMSDSCSSSEYVKSSHSYEADTMSLQDFFLLNGIDRCKLLKMDCEGSEHDIIMSNPEIFDKVDYLAGEFHINNRIAAKGYSLSKTYETLCKHIDPKNICGMGLGLENGPLKDSYDYVKSNEPCPVCGDDGILVETEGNIDYYECEINHHTWDKRRE